jgi:putative spermidine/putrescine transport system ATP-binding protein
MTTTPQSPPTRRSGAGESVAANVATERRGSSVDLTAVTKRYGSFTAVDAVDLSIAPGEFVTLLGPSGSGKTTILRMLAGFDVPTSGSIAIGGREVSRMAPAERNIGMVFQQYALFPHLTVRENILYGLRMHRWGRSEREARTVEMLELVGLSHLGARRPSELSGGQQQRVALARALAIRPQLLLMDEPLGALDRALRVDMSEEIKRLHRETGTTFLYVTHDQEEALLLSDRVAIMREGKIRALGTPEELFERPPTTFVAEFFSNSNVLDAAELSTVADRTEIVYDGRSVSVPAVVDASAVAFQPHRARVTADAAVGPDDLLITGTVSEILFMGMLHQIVMIDSTGKRLIVRTAGEDAQRLQTGAPVSIAVRRDDLILLRAEE